VSLAADRELLFAQQPASDDALAITRIRGDLYRPRRSTCAPVLDHL
jgi:hypothetical protein